MRSRRLVAGALLPFLGIAVALLICEGAARLYEAYARGGTGADCPAPAAVGEYDATLGYRLVPNSVGCQNTSEFHTRFMINPHGLRMDRDVPYEHPAGKRRILLLGDSFTFGHGVANADRFGERLQSLLPDVETINMGVWGTGTDQQLLLYLSEGVKYSADLVILAYLTENIQRNASVARLQSDGTLVGKPRFVLQDGKLVLTNVPVPRKIIDEDAARREWQDRWSRLGLVPVPLRDALTSHSAAYRQMQPRLSAVVHNLLDSDGTPFPEYDEHREEWQVTRAILVDLMRQTEQHGSRFLLVVIPTASYVYGRGLDDRPHRMIDQLATEEGVPLVDLLLSLREAARRGPAPLYFPQDGHWTPAGHAVAAQQIASYVTASFGWPSR